VLPFARKSGSPSASVQGDAMLDIDIQEFVAALLLWESEHEILVIVLSDRENETIKL
jgi:hypothetical protein